MDSPICLSPISSSSSSEADDKPNPKRQKLSSPQGKVAVIGNCGTNEGDFYYIVIIDLNPKTHVFVDDEFIRVAPTVRFKSDRRYDTNGFCILGSTFYMIESNDNEIDPPPKSVYTIDLSSYLHDDDDVVTEPNLRTLEISELGKAPDMLHPKDTPYATPTPDGKKMLVLSSFIRSEPSDEISGENDFELYDPDTRSWKQLPGIRYDWNDHFGHRYDRGRFWIAAFTFIGKSTFFIETVSALTSSSASMYAIDLESLDNGWRKCNDFYGARNTECSNFPFLVIEEELCLNSFCACDITKRDREYQDWYRFPLPSYGVEFERCGPTYVVLLDDVENGQCSFCTLESGPGRETGYPHLTIDAYHCDIAKYREDKEEKGESAELGTSITQVRLFKFLLDVEQCTSFCPRGFFTIRADAD